MMLRIFFILATLIVGNLATAFSDQKMSVAGIVKSFDTKVVQVAVGYKVYEVPRKLIMLPTLKSGQKIEFEVSEEELKKLKSTAVKK